MVLPREEREHGTNGIFDLIALAVAAFMIRETRQQYS